MNGSKNVKKFDNRQNAYSAGRAGYSEEFADALYAGHGFCESSTIADIGSGTGIFTKQLLRRGGTVYAVEPNDGMRCKAEEELGGYCNFISVAGTAEHTTLKSGSVDFITVAQAFHWFDASLFKKECRRILKPNGKIFLIWNSRDENADINRKHAELFGKYCPAFKGFNGGVTENDERIAAFFDGDFKKESYENSIPYNKDRFMQRSLSSSYSLTCGDSNYADFVNAINKFFDENEIDGIITIPNKTTVYHN